MKKAPIVGGAALDAGTKATPELGRAGSAWGPHA